MDVSDARRLKQSKAENAKIERLGAEQALAINVLMEIAPKNGDPDAAS